MNMNNKIITLIAFVLIGFCGLSQNKKYEEAMQKNLKILEIAKTSSDLEKAANGFEAVATSEKKDWLAYYYAGISNALIAFEKKGKEIDSWCDRADMQVKKADSLSKNNSEVLVLKSMISAARILANKNTRAQKYGSLSAKYAIEAIKLDDQNPRAYLLKARNVAKTPEVAGGGKKKAILVFEQALEKYKTFKPKSSIYPDWGKSEAEKELKQLKDSLNKK